MGQTTGAVKTARLSQFLQEVFRADTDLHTLRVAALTLGRLVKAGGPVTAEVVDSEVTRMPFSPWHRMPVATIMDTYFMTRARDRLSSGSASCGCYAESAVHTAMQAVCGPPCLPSDKDTHAYCPHVA